MKTLFSKKAQQPATRLSGVVAGFQKQLNGRGTGFASQQVAGAALSMEAIDSGLAIELESSVKDLGLTLESIASEHGLKLTQAQRDAAVATGIVAGDIAGFLRTPVAREVVATEGMTVVAPTVADGTARLQQALEAYDEKENKNAVVYSVAYNMQAARQDEFGEAFFPTVVVTPDQVGFSVSIRLIQVMNEVRRQISGKLDQFHKRNIIHAVIDPTILKNDQTKLVPVYRDESKDNFVASSLVAPVDIDFEGETITTSALAMGKKFSLLAVSQHEALLETGLLDSTDSIDTAIALKALYIKVGSGQDVGVLKFSTERLPTSVFNGAVQGNYRQMTLNFSTDSLLVSKDTKTVAGAAPAALAALISGEYFVRLDVSVSGSVNLELGDTSLYASNVTVVRVTDKDGVDMAMDSGVGKTIADLFADAAAIGYDLSAQRTNLNRRQRGQLLDTTFYQQLYTVPLRSPITIPRPLTVGDANDSSDLAALITATHIRTSNAAVDELLAAAQLLKETTHSSDSLATVPNILGVTRFLVQLFYEEKVIDVANEVDSLKSSDRAADISALIINQLRDTAYRMYRDSGYKAAADALAGGVSQAPTVIIGTDPYIARYLMVSGDFRTLGNDFQVKVVSTLNKRMTGKIVIAFGDFTTGTEGVPNPMHFGNMAWKPELTLVLPLHRNGANSKELTVQPSFLHVVNTPIMAVFSVTGINEVAAAKVPVLTKTA